MNTIRKVNYKIAMWLLTFITITTFAMLALGIITLPFCILLGGEYQYSVSYGAFMCIPIFAALEIWIGIAAAILINGYKLVEELVSRISYYD